MKIKDLLQMSLRNLLRRKLRTLLTVLGVVIGCVSIIIMLSLGFGMTDSTRRQMEKLGSLSQITIPQPRDQVWDDAKKQMVKSDKLSPLDDEAVSKIKKIPHVKSVMPVLNLDGVILFKKYMAWTTAVGIDPKEMQYFSFKVVEGRLLKEGDTNQVLIGKSFLKQNLYNPNARNNRGNQNNLTIDPFTAKLSFSGNPDYYSSKQSSDDDTAQTMPKPKDYKIEVVGLFGDEDYEHNYSVYMPIELLKKISKASQKYKSQGGSRNNFDYGPSNNGKTKKSIYDSIFVKVDDFNQVENVQNKIKEEGFQATSLNDILKSINDSTKTQRMILGGIGGVSLLVAAIGIANTMVMSIYERTKEIGIMKVIGASVSDIKKMFLTESAYIGLLGGILGVVLSYLLSALINYLATAKGFSLGVNISDFGPGGGMPQDIKISIIPLWLALASLVFSTLIGILSGYYPAKKATKLSALEAMKNE